MVSRVGFVVMVVLVSILASSDATARQPPTGTAIYIVRHDARLCPSPRCGGYWVTITNGVRTRCADGTRSVRCYVARAVDTRGRPLAADITEGSLVRGAIEAWRGGVEQLDELVVSAVYAPVGKAPVSGGFYRVIDTGIRCVRAPCFSYRSTPINASTRTLVSSVDLAASEATGAELARAQRALRTTNGLYARGRFARTPDGGTTFRALRIYLRAPLPRA